MSLLNVRRPWDDFFDASVRKIILEKDSILDIGGGLRIDGTRSNRVDVHHTWIKETLNESGAQYRILDYVPTFSPDIVGDIQELPLPDNSEESIVCLSILEHVANPFLAASEMHRVLVPGGFCLVYVPFLFYYHAEKGYYKDYWRFTEDSIREVFKQFSSIEIHSTRGPLETLVKLSPLGRSTIMCDLAFLVDRFTRKLSSKQTSGYNIFLCK